MQVESLINPALRPHPQAHPHMCITECDIDRRCWSLTIMCFPVLLAKGVKTARATVYHVRTHEHGGRETASLSFLWACPGCGNLLPASARNPVFLWHRCTLRFSTWSAFLQSSQELKQGPGSLGTTSRMQHSHRWRIRGFCALSSLGVTSLVGKSIQAVTLRSTHLLGERRELRGFTYAAVSAGELKTSCWRYFFWKTQSSLRSMRVLHWKPLLKVLAFRRC